MPEDFTTLLESTLKYALKDDDTDAFASVEREDADSSGEAGSIVITQADGRKFRVSYGRI